MYADKKGYIKYFILGISIGLIAFGLSIGQGETVFQKAVLICLECIGIG